MTGDTARVLRGVAGVFLIAVDGRPIGQASPRGLFRKDKIRPIPGDFVRYEASGDPDIPWRLTEILPRKNELQRPSLANLDLMILTASAAYPQVDYHYLDRMLAYVLKQKIAVMLVLTKCDLPGTERSRQEFLRYYESAPFEVHLLGFDDEESLEALKLRLKGLFSAFSGQSGVGKSTLMNRLLGEEILETAQLSVKGKCGKQTSRSVEIYSRGQLLLADTPGFQALDLQNFNLSGDDLLEAFPDIKKAAPYCRFHNCRHMGEPGCAVVQFPVLPERLARYRELRQIVEQAIRY